MRAFSRILGDNLKTVVFGRLQNIDHRFIDRAPNCATIFCGLSLDEIDADEWHIWSLGNRLSLTGLLLMLRTRGAASNGVELPIALSGVGRSKFFQKTSDFKPRLQFGRAIESGGS